MMAPIRWRDILRHVLPGLILKLIVLAIVIGLPFWWFLTQLAEHGWN